MVTSSPKTEIFDTTPRPVTVPAGKKADLVLEGGGVKGIGLVGAVLTLHEQGYEFPRAAGTSAGAITAALVAALQAAGKPLTLLEGYVNSVDYPRFQAESWLQRPSVPSGTSASWCCTWACIRVTISSNGSAASSKRSGSRRSSS